MLLNAFSAQNTGNRSVMTRAHVLHDNVLRRLGVIFRKRITAAMMVRKSQRGNSHGVTCGKTCTHPEYVLSSRRGTARSPSNQSAGNAFDVISMLSRKIVLWIELGRSRAWNCGIPAGRGGSWTAAAMAQVCWVSDLDNIWEVRGKTTHTTV